LEGAFRGERLIDQFLFAVLKKIVQISSREKALGHWHLEVVESSGSQLGVPVMGAVLC
jgi:hypothetical protein